MTMAAGAWDRLEGASLTRLAPGMTRKGTELERWTGTPPSLARRGLIFCLSLGNQAGITSVTGYELLKPARIQGEGNQTPPVADGKCKVTSQKSR